MREPVMAIRSAVTISLVPEARGGPFVFWDDLPAACRKAKELGFDAVEVFPSCGSALDTKTLGTLLSDLGLALAAVGTGAGWVREKLTLTSADHAVRSRAREFVRSVVDAAGSIGAPAIIGSMQGRRGDLDRPTALGHLADALDDLGGHAETLRVPLFLEPLNRYETDLINTVDHGLALLDDLTTRNVFLLADMFHMNIEEVDMADALRRAGKRLGHVHFVDSNRRAAGLGHIDYGPIARALGESGYSGFASAEALPFPDSDAAAVQTIEAFRTHFGSRSA